jgi:hypothetical protein
LFAALLILGTNGCGGSGSTGGGGGGGGASANVPTLIGIAPASAEAGSATTTIIVYGSNFEDGSSILWNGTPLTTGCLITLNPVLFTSCTTANAIMASIPSSDLASPTTAQVTVSNPNPGGGSSSPMDFKVFSAPATSNTWVRTVSGVTVPWDEVWDSAHGKLYVSAATQDPANPNTIVSIDPIAGTIGSTVAAGNDPHFLALSSDSSYLWASLDGAYTVQRFLLPGMTTDISVQLPQNPGGEPQQAVSLQAAPASPDTVALVAGHVSWSPPGNGVYVYDDAVQRANSVPGFETGGPEIDWIQWGADDTTIYGNETDTIDAGGIATMAVNSAGVTLTSYPDSLLLSPLITQYDSTNGILYSYAGAYDPTKPTQVGQFDISSDSEYTCTADSSLGRYFCVDVYSEGGTDVYATELWVFDLNTYGLIGRYYFGSLQGESGANQPNSPVTGTPVKLVRWGNAGLALITSSGAQYGIPVSESPYGAGGIFLIDGAAVNPNAAPDVATGGASPTSYSWLSSMSPQEATTGSGEVTVTIMGTGFTQDSTACWNCSFIQFQFLPTTYVSPTELQVVIPLSDVPTFEPLEVSVFDQSADLFSSNALTFTVLPSSGSTQITPLNVSGLAMAWDANSALLYVGVADYDAAYPNSIVAVNPTSGTIVKTQTVETDPYLLSDSSDGEYLYVGYAEATDMTQLELPSLGSPVTWPLNPLGAGTGPGPYYAYDLKASPADPDTTAVTYFFDWGVDPGASAYLGIYDGSTMRPTLAQGSSSLTGALGALAWSNSDTNLVSAGIGPSLVSDFSLVQVNSSGAALTGTGAATMTPGELHSDFGTGLVYSDNGNVANPITGALVGSYNASGLVAPDSSLDRVFILGQTTTQANTNNFTIQSFDQTGFSPISSITVSNLSGSPIEMVRWGTSGLAVLTTGGLEDVYENGFGMLYLIEDSNFVSNLQPASPAQVAKEELVQQRWKRLSKREAIDLAHRAAKAQSVCCGSGITP